MAAEFAFAFEARYTRAAQLFRVTPATTGIVVTGSHLRVRFGPWRVVVERENITEVAVTGPYAFAKTAGPARLGLTDRGLTFATNSRAGVCLQFASPITGIDPAGWIRHPNLTLTPSDVEGLRRLLADRSAEPG